MAKSSRGAGPKPSVGKLTGKGSKAGTGGGKALSKAFPQGSVPTAPALSGNADVVQQRTAAAAQGKMQQKQLKSNKSSGIRLGR